MSAYRFQLSDARADIGVRNVAGKCVNTDEFSDLVNRVTRRLMKRGSWWGLEQVVKLCVYGCDIVWPKYVSTVLGIRTCAGQMDIRNGWYAILGPTCRYDQWSSNLTMFDNGTAPCFNEISGNTGKLLRYHTVKQQDIGKTITFYGKQYGGQPLQELDANGDWQMGLTLTAAAPIAQTTVLATKITQVVRQATQGMCYLYEYDPATALLRTLAVYEPNETNPQYRRSTVRNLGNIPMHVDTNNVKSWTLEALCKLEYFPAVNDRDFLLIDDFDALAQGMQALRLEEAQDLEGAERYWMKAISELNFESRNRNPGNQFTTKVNVMGSSRIITNPI